MKKSISYLIIASAFCILFFTSCNEDPECRISRFVRLQVGFHQMVTDITTGISTSQRVSIDSLTIHIVGTDQLLVGANIRNNIPLPLNKLEDVTQFVITFFDIIDGVEIATTDILSVYYTIHERYISFQCGILHTFTIDSVRTHSTQHFIDSIVFNSLEVNNVSNAENIKIYRRPR